MIKAITIKRWNEAQEAERKLHKDSMEDALHHYRISYGHNFRYLGIGNVDFCTNIIEVGCADIPASIFVNPQAIKTIIVEPMPSDILKGLCETYNYELIQEPFESPSVKVGKDSEIWLFNVLQHTIDPEFFIYKAKKAGVIRYFEPIETGIEVYHPHSFTKDDFDRWFPGINKYYNETTNECFHNGPCCYGVYNNPQC